MTKPRRKRPDSYHAFLVEPGPDFEPTNWQDKPRQYRILQYLGEKRFRGRADAWRFLHNHQALSIGNTSIWAIHSN